MSNNAERFIKIVEGQLPTMAERTKQALEDPQVHACFESIEQKYDQQYLDLLNLLAQKYGLNMDEGEGIYHRLAHRRQLANG